MGILDVLSTALQQCIAKESHWKGAANSAVQLLEVAMTLSRLLLEGQRAPRAKGTRPLVIIDFLISFTCVFSISDMSRVTLAARNTRFARAL